HPATVENARLLRERGVAFQGPDSGGQACGEVGEGRMSEPSAILETIRSRFEHSGALAGKRVMVTAGPTYEAIDPVRFIGNRSSGKMGYAIAEAACAAGAEVTLVSGPVALEVPAGVTTVRVATAAEMRAAVFEWVAQCDIFIAAAAVADYRPASAETQKIKKDARALVLQLERTEDILAEVARLARKPFTVGFAAETADLEAYARKKLNDKGLDMIAGNLVGDGRGFDTDDNALELFWRDGGVSLPRAAKTALARELIQTITKRYHERDSA
ncbi:MAG: bifunctional phosphopantothenoylcysteine decarboxylase/phosphopantothenate--cysteine ligase CoaBC, partial [Gammaproteobacteria bacterium]|nr:bifunctional phosphopantothenoylcysteine decarboxylase/phosphopantothenate--cysteine ligase CoaBC [Gammaproteobacteria bacterium]